jgi:hypothetical protein
MTTTPTTTTAAQDVYDAIMAAGYTPTPGCNTFTDPAAKAFRTALRTADYDIAATLAPPADILATTPTAQTVILFPDYYINGPGRAVASTTLCDHGCHLTDSCPGCDHDQDNRLGVFATLVGTN